MQKKIKVEGGLRSKAEQEVASKNEKIWNDCKDPWNIKIENFTKYVRRQNLTRFLAQYEIFKKIMHVKGSIVECGVHRGGGLMGWAKLSAILEPVNLTRRIYGFDSFSGFPDITKKDKTEFSNHIKKGDLASNSKDELEQLIDVYDSDRFLGHVPKVYLVQGDACTTIPQFIEKNQHLVISLLFLDFDLYSPTKAALENFVPRMPKGAVIAFDEMDNPLWPGETVAAVECYTLNKLRVERLDFDPYTGFAILE